MNYKEIYQEWLESSYYDQKTKEELLAIKDNDKEIKERFYQDLEFGTGGLRGIIGAGTNRMNCYTVRKATQGLANYILSQGKESRGVAISYDSRRMSPEFADEAALCLAANGIKAYVFQSLRPTPELSYTVRKLGCVAGINITASHNPAEYNGYKVYWEDGSQVTPPHDTSIMEQVKIISDYRQVKTMSKSDAVQKGLYQAIGEEIDDSYTAEIKKLVIDPAAVDSQKDDLTIVYTPLHGTGNLPVRRALEELGFTRVYVVPEQELPDGNFPTVSYPNPETEEAFVLARKLALEVNADLILATDPDADRLGVLVRDHAGDYHTLTGNMTGCLLAEYELSQLRAHKSIPADGALIKTIVTTNLVDGIARNYGVQLMEVLTGFKYIGQKIREFEESGIGTYLFGFEESYGCLIGTHARDKDAVVATMVLCEAAAYYRTLGMTLWDAMVQIYEKYGYCCDSVESITMKGIEGLQAIQGIMSSLREDSPTQFGKYEILKIRDYKKNVIKDLQTGEEAPTGLPISNVLYYELSDNAWVCVRPSGTEPKVKFYLGVSGSSSEDAGKQAAELGQILLNLVKGKIS